MAEWNFAEKARKKTTTPAPGAGTTEDTGGWDFATSARSPMLSTHTPRQAPALDYAPASPALEARPQIAPQPTLTPPTERIPPRTTAPTPTTPLDPEAGKVIQDLLSLAGQQAHLRPELERPIPTPTRAPQPPEPGPADAFTDYERQYLMPETVERPERGPGILDRARQQMEARDGTMVAPMDIARATAPGQLLHGVSDAATQMATVEPPAEDAMNPWAKLGGELYAGVIERPAWGLTEGLFRLGRGALKHSAIAEATLTEDMKERADGWLSRYIDYYGAPEEHAPAWSRVTTERERIAEAAREKSAEQGILIDAMHAVTDVAALLVQMATLNKFGLTKDSIRLSGSLADMYARYGRIGAHAIATSPGEGEERIKGAITRVAYMATPPIARALGKSALSVFALDSFLNMGISAPHYIKALKDHGISEESAQVILPGLAMDFAWAVQTAQIPRTHAERAMEKRVRTLARHHGVSEKEVHNWFNSIRTGKIGDVILEESRQGMELPVEFRNVQRAAEQARGQVEARPEMYVPRQDIERIDRMSDAELIEYARNAPHSRVAQEMRMEGQTPVSKEHYYFKLGERKIPQEARSLVSSVEKEYIGQMAARALAGTDADRQAFESIMRLEYSPAVIKNLKIIDNPNSSLQEMENAFNVLGRHYLYHQYPVLRDDAHIPRDIAQHIGLLRADVYSRSGNEHNAREFIDQEIQQSLRVFQDPNTGRGRVGFADETANTRHQQLEQIRDEAIERLKYSESDAERYTTLVANGVEPARAEQAVTQFHRDVNQFKAEGMPEQVAAKRAYEKMHETHRFTGEVPVKEPIQIEPREQEVREPVDLWAEEEAPEVTPRLFSPAQIEAEMTPPVTPEAPATPLSPVVMAARYQLTPAHIQEVVPLRDTPEAERAYFAARDEGLGHAEAMARAREIVPAPEAVAPEQLMREILQRGGIKPPARKTKREQIPEVLQAQEGMELAAMAKELGMTEPQLLRSLAAPPPAPEPVVPAIVDEDVPFRTEAPAVTPEAPVAPTAEAPTAERRRDHALRAEIDKLSPDERAEVISDLREMVFTDDLTGLRNRAAYMTDEKLPYQAMIDLDGLKWINDNIGHAAGDALIKAFAEELPEGSYHISGDEFVVQAISRQKLLSMMDDLQERVSEKVLELAGEGRVVPKRGIEFSYGIGDTLERAESAMQQHKMHRLEAGERAARGEAPRGIVEDRPTAEAPAVTPEAPASLTPISKTDKQPWEMSKEEFEAKALYQGVRAGNVDDRYGLSGYVTPLPGTARAFGEREGAGFLINITYNENMPEGTFTDPDTGEELTPEEFWKYRGQVGTALPEEIGWVTQLRFADLKEAKGFSKNPHKYLIQQALSQGLPVPPEVLEEYPDLKTEALAEAPVEAPPEALRLEHKRVVEPRAEAITAIPLNQWVVYSTVPDAYVAVKVVGDKLIYLADWADGSMILNLRTGVSTGWFDDNFESEILKHITKDEYELYRDLQAEDFRDKGIDVVRSEAPDLSDVPGLKLELHKPTDIVDLVSAVQRDESVRKMIADEVAKTPTDARPGPSAETIPALAPAETPTALWDEATESHFQAWLDKTIPDRLPEERAAVEAGIRRYAEENPDVLDRGWPEIRRMAETEGYTEVAAPTEETPAPVDAAPTVPAKEPWEITEGDWIKQVQEAKHFTPAPGSHEEHVRDALGAGKPVPPEVLEEYPDLKTEAPAPPAPAEQTLPQTRDIVKDLEEKVRALDRNEFDKYYTNEVIFKLEREAPDVSAQVQDYIRATVPEGELVTAKNYWSTVRGLIGKRALAKSGKVEVKAINDDVVEALDDKGKDILKALAGFTAEKYPDRELEVTVGMQPVSVAGFKGFRISVPNIEDSVDGMFPYELGILNTYRALEEKGVDRRLLWAAHDWFHELGHIVAPGTEKEMDRFAEKLVEEFSQWRPEKPPAPPKPKEVKTITTGKSAKPKTERGTEVETGYALVEVGDLTASHSTALNINPAYPKELQPRDRTRMASEAQIGRIMARLEPEFLGESPKVSEGAPVVGPDGVVESGNARVIAIDRMYKQNHANRHKYRDWLLKNAEKFGLDKQAIKDAKNPVLVRVRQTDVDRVQFVEEANEQAVAAMSASEQAVMDAKKLTGPLINVFQPSETGEVLTAANREFINTFMREIVGEAERSRYVDAKGALSQEGANRIRNAVFARAYGDSGAVEKLAESTDVNVRNQINAMLMAAPRMLQVREGIEQGGLYELDIAPDVAKAMTKLSALREQGMSVQDYLRQQSLFDDVSPLVKDILDVFDKNKRSAKKIASILQAYGDAVFLAGDPRQQTLFKAGQDPTKAELLQTAISEVEGLGEAQLTLFSREGMGSQGITAPQETALTKEEVAPDKTLPEGLKKIGFDTREHAQLAFDAKDLGFSQWNLTFEEDKDLIFKYTGKMQPREAYEELTKPLRGLPAKEINQRRMDLQMFARRSGKEPDPVRDKARRRMFAISRKLGMDRAQRIAMAQWLLNRPDLQSTRDLTRNEMVELSEMLSQYQHQLKVSDKVPATEEARSGVKKVTAAEARKAQRDLHKAVQEEELLHERIKRQEELGYEVVMASDVYKLMGRQVPADEVDMPVGWIWDKQVYVPSAREMAKWPEKEIRNLTKENNILDQYLRPIFRVLPRELTDDGMKAKHVFTAFQDKYLKVVNEALKGFTEQERINVAAMLEGLTDKKGKEGRAADKIKTEFFDPLFKQAVSAGVLEKGQYVAEYFSRISENVKKATGEPLKVPQRWFQHQRTGKMEDYKKDVQEVCNIYANAMGKAIHVDPFLKKWKSEINRMPRTKAGMATAFVDAVYGRPLAWEMMMNQLVKDGFQLLGRELPEGVRPSQDVSRAIISAVVQAYMGLNPGSAIKNLTQKMLVVADVATLKDPMRGFRYLTRAKAFKLTREGRQFVETYCTLLKDRTYTEGLERTSRYEWKINKLLDSTSKVTMAAFKWADKDNVTDGFLVGLFAAQEDGKDMKDALWAANDVALRTQFPYDIRKPLLFHNPVARLAGLFASWPIHFSELAVDWLSSSGWAKLLLVATLLSGLKYLTRKMGIHLRIGLLDTAMGHIAFRTASGEQGAVTRYMKDLASATQKLASFDKEETLKGLEEMAYLSPGGVAYKRMARFHRASQDDWRLRNTRGRVYYQFAKEGVLYDLTGIPDEAVRSLLGQTTESYDHWKSQYPTPLDKAEEQAMKMLRSLLPAESR